VGDAPNTFSYANDVATMLGVTTFNKLAVSGTKVYDSGQSDYLGQCGNEGSYKITATPDLITIMMGINDAPDMIGKNGASPVTPIGNVADVIALTYTHDSTKTARAAYNSVITSNPNSAWETFLGKFRFGIEFLKNKYPNARIIVITPIQCASKNSGG